jgi:putative addiction module killer protein
MIEVLVYSKEAGAEPFTKWLNTLDATAFAKVQVNLQRLAAGNTSNVKSLGDGVSELKIAFGPGYRVYFGWEGSKMVILLAGGTKQRQSVDIARAKLLWREYQASKFNTG